MNQICHLSRLCCFTRTGHELTQDCVSDVPVLGRTPFGSFVFFTHEQFAFIEIWFQLGNNNTRDNGGHLSAELSDELSICVQKSS